MSGVELLAPFDAAIQRLKDLSCYTLANEAGTSSPDTRDSAGAVFLADVRDAVVEAIEYDKEILTSDQGEDVWSDCQQDWIDPVVPTYSDHTTWQAYVDLGGYRYDHDGDPSSIPSDPTEQAQYVLYMIGETLGNRLVSIAREIYAEVASSQACGHCGSDGEECRTECAYFDNGESGEESLTWGVAPG